LAKVEGSGLAFTAFCFLVDFGVFPGVDVGVEMALADPSELLITKAGSRVGLVVNADFSADSLGRSFSFLG
jgi:hypothetical protein